MGSIDPATLQGAYRVGNDYHSKPQHLRVICAGAGATGLCLAYKMKEKFNFENYDLVCYEKNSGVGGTWFENRYPGCACDMYVPMMFCLHLAFLKYPTVAMLPRQFF